MFVPNNWDCLFVPFVYVFSDMENSLLKCSDHFLNGESNHWGVISITVKKTNVNYLV